MLELEAKIEPGNSGSPVFDRDDNVVGVVSSRWETTDSFALATPVEVLRELLTERYDDDLVLLLTALTREPPKLAAEANDVLTILNDLQEVMPTDAESQQRKANLAMAMGEVVAQASDCEKDMKNGMFANASRHFHRMKYIFEARKPDIRALMSIKRAISVEGI
jgi:hypothetical protein